MDRSASVELPLVIAQAIGRGATIVTGNQRAARSLRQIYDNVQRTAGLLAWEPPCILAWDSWTAEIWRGLLLEGHALSMLLSRNQEHLVWQSIISDDRKNLNVLRSVDSLAHLASDAWRLVAQYRAVSRLGTIATSFEARSYMRWARQFEQRCTTHHWISSASLEEALIEHAKAGRLRLEEIVLTGIDYLTPVRRELVEVLGASNIDAESAPTIPTDLNLVVARDESEEIASAARWARDILQREDQKTIAVIVPALDAKRAAVDRTFREILTPELGDITRPEQNALHEFSVGVPLTQTSLVRKALDLLHWAMGPLPVERVSALLVSPLLALGEGEMDVRAIFDAFEVRRAKMLLKPEVSIEWLLELNTRPRKRKLPGRLVSALESMTRVAARYGVATKKRTFGDWSEIFRSLLREVRWGYGETKSSREFQLEKRWESSLDELASLNFMGGQVIYRDALLMLEKICQETIFASESRQAPIQILGPLESAGSSFDAIWFLGVGDFTWPEKPTFNSLLPWALQREMEMPGDVKADGERNARIARRISKSAPLTIFSYPKETSVGSQRLSSVIAELNPTLCLLEDVVSVDAELPITKLEELLDVIPLPVTPDTTIPGGAEILKLQSACGFRAFAEKRLFASELRSVTLGMDLMERGTVVHSALESFWKEVKSQHALRSMSEEERKRTIDRAVEEGMYRLHQRIAAEWELAYVEVQRERLKVLLANWLKTELGRESFEVKMSEQEFKDVPVGPLRLTVRVDRVDTTESGDVIIDYKTGSARPSEWLTERPDAPQLPLYAVIASDLNPENPLADIAFAKVHAGKDAVFDGYMGKVVDGAWSENRRRRPITDQLDEWRTVLVDLAKSFHHGDTRVDPKMYPHTCKYCAQRIFCRLDPTTIETNEEMNDQPEIE